MFSEKIKLDLPEAFPCSEFEAFLDESRAVLLPEQGAPWREFAGASNLIGWRFRACSEYFENYLFSWRQFGPNASFEQIYSRERDMFGMFVSGVSCIESISYSVSALASHPNVLALQFGEQEQRKCSPSILKRRLEGQSNATAIVQALALMLHSPEWKLWTDLRNRMAHRSNLPRRHYLGSAPATDHQVHFVATSSTPDAVGDEAWFSHLFEWLVRNVEGLLKGGRQLAVTANRQA